jgi:hypothetical protein
VQHLGTTGQVTRSAHLSTQQTPKIGLCAGQRRPTTRGQEDHPHTRRHSKLAHDAITPCVVHYLGATWRCLPRTPSHILAYDRSGPNTLFETTIISIMHSTPVSTTLGIDRNMHLHLITHNTLASPCDHRPTTRPRRDTIVTVDIASTATSPLPIPSETPPPYYAPLR